MTKEKVLSGRKKPRALDDLCWNLLLAMGTIAVSGKWELVLASLSFCFLIHSLAYSFFLPEDEYGHGIYSKAYTDSIYSSGGLNLILFVVALFFNFTLFLTHIAPLLFFCFGIMGHQYILLKAYFLEEKFWEPDFQPIVSSALCFLMFIYGCYGFQF